MSYFAHHFVGVRVGKEIKNSKNRKLVNMKIKSILLLVITSFVALLVSATPAKAQNYRYRDGGDQYYGYEQRPRAEVITRKVWYRDNCGRLYYRYVTETIIPPRACVEEVYEPAPAPYYRGSYSIRGGYCDDTNTRYGSSRLPNLPNPPQPHKHIERGAKKVTEEHKEHRNKFFGWIKERF